MTPLPPPTRDGDAPSPDRGRRVLVIERGFTAGRLLARLAGHAGLSVVSVSDGRQALARLAGDEYDAVLVELPVAGAVPAELYRRIVAVNARAADGVVFLAADLLDPGTRRFLTRVGRPFLTQPVTDADLLDLVLNAVRERPA